MLFRSDRRKKVGDVGKTKDDFVMIRGMLWLEGESFKSLYFSQDRLYFVVS